MSSIRILPEDVSNRIAAGEVIERPASVVKELVENAVDAGATRITINVERGGRSLVRVVDDGSGMDAEDALLCLEAHATSKIKSAGDIETIHSFGFRGEALPSIASVTRFSMRTRLATADEGTEVTSNGGVIQNVNAVGCAAGTSITVRNLFYNLPARRKFLRQVGTEESHIEETVLLVALANAAVSFELTFDGRPVITVQGDSDIRTRAALLLGRDTMAAMLPLDFAEEGIRVSGLVARPGLTRSSRREQRTFVNGRPVTSDSIYFALRDAYHSLVMKGRYPPALVFVDVEPDRVDVNVHPAKREVRFRDSRTVGRVVGIGIRQAMRGLVTPAAFPEGPGKATDAEIPQPAIDFAAAAPTADGGDASGAFASTAPAPYSTSDASYAGTDALETAPVPGAAAPIAALVAVTEDGTPGPGTSVSAATRDQIRGLNVIGSIADLYLVAEGASGIVLIDQHAAHERVMFEKFLKEAKAMDGMGQGLLIPITLDFSAADADVLRRNLEAMTKLGFALEEFGGNSYIVSAVPAHFPQENIAGLMRDMIDELRDAPLRSRRADEARIAQCACKAAVKANDRLSDMEVEGLLAELVETELPYTCPHGRPTMINVSFKELEKRFGRRV